MAIIAHTLAPIKSYPLWFQGGADHVTQCFADVGHVWRDRVLTPANTMALFVLQVLHGNTAISHLRLLSAIAFAESSYCAARAKLPLAGVAATVAQVCGNGGRGRERGSSWLGRGGLLARATNAPTPERAEPPQRRR